MGDVSDDAGAPVFAAFAGSEFNGGFDFGKHRAGFEIAVFNKAG